MLLHQTHNHDGARQPCPVLFTVLVICVSIAVPILILPDSNWSMIHHHHHREYQRQFHAPAYSYPHRPHHHHDCTTIITTLRNMRYLQDV